MSARTLHSEADTALFAASVAKSLRGGVTIGLEGELGAGKTTFVRYLIKALGGKAEEVASPTFTLEYEYSVDGGLRVEHWDLYRLTAAPPELLEPPSAKVLRIIEWPSRCPEILADIDLRLEIGLLEGDARTVSISGALAQSLPV